MKALRPSPRTPRPMILAAALSMFLGAGTTSTASFFTIAISAEQGDPSPDPNASFSKILEFGPALNNSGGFAFGARLDNDSNDNTIIGAGTGPARFLLRQHDFAPDDNGTFQAFTQFSLNRAGRSAFVATLGNTSGTNTQRGAFISSDDVGQIIRGGQSPPGGNGTIAEFPATTPEHGIALNSIGQLAALVRLAGTSGGSGDNLAIYKGNGAALTEVARRGQSPPGGGTITDLGPPSINDAGQVAFRARIDGTNTFGFYRQDGSRLTKMVRTGDWVPGAGTVSTANSTEAPVNLAGHIACSVDLNGTNNNEVILLATGSPPTTIARKGSLAPGGGTFHSFSFSQVSLNDHDAVAFSARIEASPGRVIDSLCLWDGSALHLIAAKDMASPDGNGQFSSFDAPAINRAGDVLFQADLSAASPGTSNGLFYYRASTGTLHQVVRLGASLAGGTIGELIFLSLPHLGNAFNGFNDSGQIAFYYRLTNGKCGIAMATPTDLSPPSITITSTETTASDFILTWSIDNNGGVDVYRSPDLLLWGTPLSTNNIAGSFTDSPRPSGAAFYTLVPAGQSIP